MLKYYSSYWQALNNQEKVEFDLQKLISEALIGLSLQKGEREAKIIAVFPNGDNYKCVIEIDVEPEIAGVLKEMVNKKIVLGGGRIS
jgi:hypothetical protein